MAENTTSWILELVDKITGPVKKIMEDVGAATLGLGEFSAAAQKGTAVTDEMLKKATGDYNRLTDELKTAQSELDRMQESYSEMYDEASKTSAADAIESQKEKITELSAEVKEAEKSYRKLKDTASKDEALPALEAQKQQLKEMRAELREMEKGYRQMNDEASKTAASDAIEAQREKVSQLNEELGKAGKELTGLGRRLVSQTAGGFLNALTKPFKELPKTIKNALKSVIGFRDENRKMTSSLKSDLDLAKREYNRLGSEINKAKKEVKDWENSITDTGKRKLEEARQKVADLEDAFREAGEEVQRLNSEIKNVDNDGTLKLVLKINQFSELVGKVTRSLQFTVDYKEQEKQIARLTDLTGDALTEYTKKSREIADVYGQDALKAAQAANTMTKQFGGTYESNFELLEEGFKKGADLSGNLLSNMEKYSGAFVDMGMSAETAMAIMAKAEKDGFDADKAIEGIKQAGEKLTELGPAQQKVLEKIGVSMEKISGKTAWEAVQIVSKSMTGMNDQVKTEVLTKIFGNAGKDSGIAFVEELSKEIPDLSKLEPVEESAAGFKRIASNIKSWMGDVFGNMGIYADQFAPLIQSVAGAIPIIEMLTKVTGLQTIATRLMGLTILGTPIGWLIGIIAVLIGAVVLCWNKFEGFREAVFIAWERLKLLGNVIKDYVIGRIQGLISGITGLGSALTHFFKGEWSEAFAAGKKATLDLMGADAGIEAGKKFSEGYNKATADGIAKHKVYEENRNKKKEPTGFSINEFLGGDAKNLSFDPITEEGKKGKDKKGKSGKESGMSIAGKGALNIRMIINNYFNVAPGVNSRKLAEEVAGIIGDRLEDAVVTI